MADTDRSVIIDTDGRRRVRRAGDRRGEIIAAGMKLFVAKGYAATKLDDVAREAGVSKGLPYLYFSSKEELFKAVIQEAILPPLIAGEERLRTHQGTMTDLLRSLATDYIGFVREISGGVAKLVVAEAGNFPEIARFYVEEIAARGRAFLAALIERGVAGGEFRPVDVQGTAAVLASPLVMLSIWHHSLGPYETAGDPERFLHAYADLVIAGLRR